MTRPLWVLEVAVTVSPVFTHLRGRSSSTTPHLGMAWSSHVFGLTSVTADFESDELIKKR
jgi:hypothetical protein